ncbi:hypothetical protein MRX96_045093 [Rhipicephalus microplus]
MTTTPTTVPQARLYHRHVVYDFTRRPSETHQFRASRAALTTNGASSSQLLLAFRAAIFAEPILLQNFTLYPR